MTVFWLTVFGSSPLARGALGAVLVSFLRVRLIPASAGSTTHNQIEHCIFPAHPR